MNYGKKKTSQKQKKITSKAAMQKKRIGVRLFQALLLCILLIAIVGVVGGGLFIKKIIDDTPEVSASDIKPQGYTTFVYADDGTTEIERFVSSGANRIYKSIDEIPVDLQHAFVAIEDERFYEHNGIDLQGIARAAIVGIASGGNFSEGASTLTQQLIKNNVFPNFVNEETLYERLERKLQEQYLAVAIEKQMDKDTILENYLNTINLGQNCLGVQAAAKRYFNKDVSELNLSECAAIAAITQNPTGYNPITNPEDNKERRDLVLSNMLEQGYIDQAAYDEAIQDDVYARIQTVNSTANEEDPYSYFIDALSEQVINDLQEQLGYTETQAYNALYSGGLSIYSTQNLAMQQICDEEINDEDNYPNSTELGLDYALTVTRADGTIENYGSNNISQYAAETYGDDEGLLYSSEDEALAVIESWKATIAQDGDTYDEVVNLTPQPQASFTLMDQSTGQIKALVGGRGTKSTSLGLNRAYTGSTRQPGSCFKILAVYAPALDSGGKTLATTLVDEPLKLNSGDSVVNATGTYSGTVTIRKAIINSINTVAVKLSDEITQEVGMEYCEKFGISTLVRSEEINGDIYSDLTQTMAIGGLTNGVYNYEMCAAYASIANGGVYNTPTLYTKILDHDGNVLLEGTGESRKVIEESTAALLTSAMQDVVTQGTGTNDQISNQAVAGKTGTTDDDRDLWFCGYTPYYTAAIWCGYDDNKSMSFSHSFKDIIWSKIMTRIHANLETKQFTMPSSVEQLTVCTSSGKLASNGCPATTEYFATATAPKDYCTQHYVVYTEESSDSDDEDSESSDTENTEDSEDSDGTENTDGTESGDGDGGDVSQGDDAGGDAGDEAATQ
jgi:penicillin-binding protein 1A